MYRFFVAIFMANLLGGCHLIFPFHPAQAVDSGTDANDGGQTDKYLLDVLHSDTHPPDTFKPDIDLCKEVSCNYGKCNTADGKCQCNVGYSGQYCGQCAFAYIGYPSCVVIQPTMTYPNVGCDQDCASGTTYTVSWQFTDATTFSAQLIGVSVGSLETTSHAPITLGIPYPLPVTTTATPTWHTINWIMGGPPPADLTVKIIIYGPTGLKAEASKQVHVIN